MKTKVYVDGQEGTTGLEILGRLEGRPDLEILTIAADKRKDTTERKRLINSADFVFLCLPDDAAREAANLVDNPKVRLLDASSAHRTHADWAYGIPELSAIHRQRIQKAHRVSVPGCYASGFVIAMNPLVASGIVPKNYPVSCFAISGYSGAGKKAIAQYEQDETEANREELFQLASPRLYALNLNHKHLPEMKAHTGLENAPLFNPIIANIYKGMTVNIPLFGRLLAKSAGPRELQAVLAKHYADSQFVKVQEYEETVSLDGGFLHARACDNTNRIELFVFGTPEQMLVSARLDNLGKGASGAAVQCLNIMMGIDEATGLIA